MVTVDGSGKEALKCSGIIGVVDLLEPKRINPLEIVSCLLSSMFCQNKTIKR